MDKEIREKIHRIMDLCLDAKELGHDCICRFEPYINNFQIQVYLFGWESKMDTDYEKHISLKRGTIEKILENFDEIINYLENIKNLNEKEMKLQTMKRKFDSIIECSSSSNLRDCNLSNLMTKMEEVFSIPSFNDETFNQNNSDVMELYKSISDERSFVKNLRII